jgi:hypothetical protein
MGAVGYVSLTQAHLGFLDDFCGPVDAQRYLLVGGHESLKHSIIGLQLQQLWSHGSLGEDTKTSQHS